MKAEKFSILIVDDSPTQISLLQDVLEKRGYSVDTAGNGMEAITRVYRKPPALILSDVLMPELNGYHLCRLLKNDPHTVDIPIILLTNLKEPHDRFWGEKAGADRYLEKSSDLRPILEAVKELLSGTPLREVNGIPPPLPEIDSSDIHSRLTSILDRTLYESTISNEVLKLTGLAHDIKLLARNFLEFLSVICGYKAAGLLLKNGRDKYFVCLQTIGPASEEFIEEARNTILSRSSLPDATMPAQVRFSHFRQDPGAQQAPAAKCFLLHFQPIMDDGRMIASISLFDEENRIPGAGTRQSLALAADRFLIVARYLKKIKDIEDVKSDFTSMLVHDMRSPLTSIRGFTDILAEGILGTVNTEQADALTNIQNGCDRLLTLIEDILDLAKLEAGKMHIEALPLHLLPVCERIVTDLSTLFREKELQVRIEIPKGLPYVTADPKQLTRVLVNLLTNAAQHTPPGGTITLQADPNPDRAVREPENSLLISVSDTGPGIPVEQQARLFGRYQQLAASSMYRRGTGLGLAICKEIVTLHGGRIWVESPIDDQGGSRFHFTLPVTEL